MFLIELRCLHRLPLQYYHGYWNKSFCVLFQLILLQLELWRFHEALELSGFGVLFNPIRWSTFESSLYRQNLFTACR